MLFFDESMVKDYYYFCEQFKELIKDMIFVIYYFVNCMEFMQFGCVIQIEILEGVNFGWGVLFDIVVCKVFKYGEFDYLLQEQYFCDVFFKFFKESKFFNFVVREISKKGGKFIMLEGQILE